MATSLFFMATDQNPAANPQALLPRNTHLVGTGEIRSEPPRSRGRKPGSKAAQNQKKIRQRGMGVAQLERLREQEEKKMADASSTIPNPNTRFPIPDPVVIGSFPVLQGLPSYGGPTICPVVGPSGSGSGPVVPKINRSFTRFAGFCCGTESGQIPVDPPPVYSPETWGFIETSKELSSMPNPHVYNCSDRCEVCFKKKRYDGDGIRSNGGGICRYGMISPVNGHDTPVFVQERNIPISGYDHRNGYLARTVTAPPGPLNCSNPCSNYEGSMEMLGSYMRGNPRNGGPAPIIKEYEFFPGKHETFSGKHETFPGKYGQRAYPKEMEAPVVSVGDCSTNTSAIDLSLKL
ncbi:PREDICTED: protein SPOROCYTELESS-like [Tarenaya hassleriana]|uniref:protein SPOROCYTELESS-like n=1 Tax=Tarenaya hassleriana TaxID=28532 RepID=UPI00053C190B|nr:PREDICTED: protein SPOROCYTELESS-like [Tarenaya hassleriana]